jgi:hypothetical protein
VRVTVADKAVLAAVNRLAKPAAFVAVEQGHANALKFQIPK